MSKVVLHTSAFLAIANREAGAEQVIPVLRQAQMSTINAAEVLTKLVQKGMPLSGAEKYLCEFVSNVVPFDLEQAGLCASIDAATRTLGLSLGDRACLALGLEMKCPVYTADPTWSKLELGLEIVLIRKPSTEPVPNSDAA